MGIVLKLNNLIRVATVPDGDSDVFLYVRKLKTDDYKIIRCESIEAAHAQVGKACPNPDYYITVDGREVYRRKRVVERACVLGMHGSRAEGLPRLVQSRTGENPESARAPDTHMLRRNSKGTVQRVPRPVAPMSPKAAPPPSDLLLAAESDRRAREAVLPVDARKDRLRLVKRQMQLEFVGPVKPPDATLDIVSQAARCTCDDCARRHRRFLDALE